MTYLTPRDVLDEVESSVALTYSGQSYESVQRTTVEAGLREFLAGSVEQGIATARALVAKLDAADRKAARNAI